MAPFTFTLLNALLQVISKTSLPSAGQLKHTANIATNSNIASSDLAPFVGQYLTWFTNSQFWHFLHQLQCVKLL